MKKIVYGTIAALVGTALLVGCSQQCPLTKEKETAPGAAKKKDLVFVMVPKGVHPYYEPCYQGFELAAKKYGVKVEFLGAKQFEVPQQVEIIENLIARKVDGVAISALDDQGLVSVIKQAADAGVKVITFDAPAPSSQALCYIGTQNETAGYAGGEVLAKLMGGEGEVAVLQGGLGAQNLNDRFKGFEKALKEKAPNIKIVDRQDTQAKVELVVNKTEALLQAHPNLKAIFAVSAEGIPGAAPILKQQNKVGKIILAGFDDMPDSVSAIKEGVASFCIAQKTLKMGWLSVEKLLDAVNGKPVEKLIDTGVMIVTKDNVNTYMDDMKKEFVPVTGDVK